MSPSTPARRPWTADERKKLDELINAGKTAPEIASALQRTPTSIYAQLQRLEIKKATRRLELGLKGEGEANETAARRHSDLDRSRRRKVTIAVGRRPELPRDRNGD